MLIFFLLLTYSISGALGMVLIKKGGNKSTISIEDNTLSINLEYKLFAGVLLYVISFILWIIILQVFPIVYISPIAYGLNFIFIALFASFMLKEKIKFIEFIGVATIIIGVIFVSFKF